VAIGDDEAPVWYPWYWSAFNKSTRGWPFIARAIYRELLDIQWQEGSIPKTPEKARIVVGCTLADWQIAWPFCEEKFPLNGNKTCRQNWVQAQQRQKSVKLVSQKRASGRAGGKARAFNELASRSQAPAKQVLNTSTSTSTVTATDTPEKNKDTVRRDEPRQGAEPDWLPEFKIRYPKRAGDFNWRGAIRAANARLAEGCTVAEFLAGAERYARYIRHIGKEHTEFVKQAATFLGPAKPFLDLWELPQAKGDRQLDRNISASQDWLEESRR
jgi:hypothetical protein